MDAVGAAAGKLQPAAASPSEMARDKDLICRRFMNHWIDFATLRQYTAETATGKRLLTQRCAIATHLKIEMWYSGGPPPLLAFYGLDLEG